jgi:hypothetical protein
MTASFAASAKIVSSMPKKRIVALLALMLCFAAVASAEDKRATVNFTVINEDKGKPIRAASVIIHPLDSKGRQKDEGQQLKTSSEGKTTHPGIRFGKVRIQVIARGYQTFGDDYLIDQDTMDIVIKLKRPQEQHSIYK